MTDEPSPLHVSEPPREPYKGLRPYEEQDQGYFFGRDADRDILIDKILTNKLTLLFAATGVGKSSLLQAAVMPQLKDPRHEHLDVVYFKDWVVDPLSELKRTVLHVLQERGRLDPGVPLEHLDSSSLTEFFQFCALFARQPLVVILDQFEEFFQYQRYTEDFQPFIRQLSAVITDRDSPIALVISMREDFALELNAFKPYLPTLLFENFYRLEKLDKESAKTAIVRPAELVGFHYEGALLDALLKDLAVREQNIRTKAPVADLMDTVEPPYLQITCSQLWDLEQQNPEKTLRLKTYQERGRAQGLLKTYFENIISHFSVAEKGLASLSFNHLITRRGTKMAYTVDDLASMLDVDAQALGKVLERLERARILRRQSRQGVLWYELYHDLFSDIIEEWNEAYKATQRNKRAVVLAAIFLVVGLVAYAAYDVAMNTTNYHLRLSAKQGVSDAIELYQGKAGSRDILGLQHYIADTGYQRAQVEPDKLFTEKPVEEFEQLDVELIGYLPLIERIKVYWEGGQVEKAVKLSEKSISDSDVQRSRAVINILADSHSVSGFRVLKEHLGSLSNATLKAEILTTLGMIRTPESLELLLPTLTDQDRDVRQSAAQALGQLGSAKAEEPLLKLLTDQDRDVRQSAAQALGQLGSVKAEEPLLKLLTDRDRDVRSSALLALGKIGDPQARDGVLTVFHNVKERRTVRIAAAATLLALKQQEGLSFLTEIIGSEQQSDREQIAMVLGNCFTESGPRLLVSLLKDENLLVRRRAIESLGKIKAKEAISELPGLIEDADVETQTTAIKALAQIASADNIAVFRTAAENPQLALSSRLAALTALRNIETDKDKALQAILEVAEKEDGSLGLRAYKLLGDLQARQALPLLHTRLQQLREQYSERRRIRDAKPGDSTQEQVDQKQSSEAARSESYKVFELAYAISRIDPEAGVALLSHDLADVRYGAWVGLGEVGTVELVQRLDTLRMESKNPLFRHAAYRVIDHILTTIEGRGGEKELSELNTLLPQVRDREGVYSRVEWAILQLKGLSDESTRDS